MTELSAVPSLDNLLDVLAEYLTLRDVECLTLPRHAYLSPELYRHELETIFHHEWLCVGRDEHVPRPGDYYCLELLGEPLIIVRGEDGEVRALSSVCRHRYMPVTEGSGNTTRFICPYHAWTYATDGKLVAAPYMAGSSASSWIPASSPVTGCRAGAGFCSSTWMKMRRRSKRR